jgi:hypothetical protein
MLFSPGLLQGNRIARRLERPRDRRLPLLDGQLPLASAVGAKEIEEPRTAEIPRTTVRVQVIPKTQQAFRGILLTRLTKDTGVRRQRNQDYGLLRRRRGAELA